MQSSVIRGAWYVPDRKELSLLFVSGRRYTYSEVPAGVADGLAEAPSKGGYYNAVIRNCFPCRESGAERRQGRRR